MSFTYASMHIPWQTLDACNDQGDPPRLNHTCPNCRSNLQAPRSAGPMRPLTLPGPATASRPPPPPDLVVSIPLSQPRRPPLTSSLPPTAAVQAALHPPFHHSQQTPGLPKAPPQAPSAIRPHLRLPQAWHHFRLGPSMCSLARGCRGFWACWLHPAVKASKWHLRCRGPPPWLEGQSWEPRPIALRQEVRQARPL